MLQEPEVVESENVRRRRPMALVGQQKVLLDHFVPHAGRHVIEARLGAGCWCGGASVSLVKRRTSGGANTVTLQCQQCGSSVGGPLRREHHPHWSVYPDWNEAIREEYSTKQREQYRAERAAELKARRDAAAVFYQSAVWQNLRAKTLARAGNICEACGTWPATTAHHTTYAFGLDAPLFSLRAVCTHCHERLHTSGDSWHDQQLPAHRSIFTNWDQNQ